MPDRYRLLANGQVLLSIEAAELVEGPAWRAQRGSFVRIIGRKLKDRVLGVLFQVGCPLGLDPPGPPASAGILPVKGGGEGLDPSPLLQELLRQSQIAAIPRDPLELDQRQLDLLVAGGGAGALAKEFSDHENLPH